MINKEILAKIVTENLEFRIDKLLCSKGYEAGAARKVFRFISNIYSQFPPELISWQFKVFFSLEKPDFTENKIIHIDCIKDVFTEDCTIVMLSESTFVLERLDTVFDAQSYISYIYKAPLNEEICIAGETIPLTEYYDSVTSSIFAYPAYRELDEAISIYDKTLARNSTCGILKQSWKDESRMEFCEKPEHYMRDSLWQYLNAVLRNHTVKREQVVDDSHPVDIKVIWPIISNVALIEVKWLGNSGATQYRDSRAKAGAKQLIEYLDASYEEEPDKNFVGYLAVFDGRRGKSLNQFADVEIKYDPTHLNHPKMKFCRFYLQQCV